MSSDTLQMNILTNLKFLGLPEVLNTLIIDYTLDLFEFFKYYYSKYFSIRKEGSTFKEHIRDSFLSVLKECRKKNMSFLFIINNKFVKNCEEISSLLLDDDNVKLAVTHEDSSIVYLTNKNWYIYESYFSYYEFSNILFFGPVSYIGDGWCKNIIAKSVDFFGLNMLRIVEERWLYSCHNLKKVNFCGLSRLRKVSHRWLFNSVNLININFNGLSKLNIVGDNWLKFRSMDHLSKLEQVDCSCLCNLRRVGDGFLDGNTYSLKMVNFKGCKARYEKSTLLLEDIYFVKKL
jgi:hypothetical protein